MIGSNEPSPAAGAAPPSGRVVVAAATGALGGFLFGFDSSVINGAVGAIEAQFEASGFVLGFAVSAALIGAALGAWFAGRLADRLGRVRVMLIAAIVFLISGLGSGLAFAIWDLTIWRFVGGAAIGAASVIAPAYIAEIAPARMRGRLGSLQQLAIVIGIFAALLTDALLANIAGGASAELWFGLEAWRWMFISIVIPAGIYGLASLRLPESPRYLVARRRVGDARRVLERYVGGEPDTKIAEIEESLRSDKPFSLSDLRGPALGLLPIVWAGILLSVFQQFVGINVIFYYSTVLWQAVGFTEEDSFTISVITSVTNVLTTLIAIALVDRVGRKPLLLTGSAGMAVTLGTLSFLFGTAPLVESGGELAPQLGPVAGPVALVAANLFVVFFGATWGPIVWVLLGEMFNNRIRASALALAAAAQWIANWIVTTTFPPLSEVSLGLAYGLYTLFAVISFVFVWRMIRETKGRELEEM
ncbi:MAG TPA: sugar porter family MFS transporter [Actinopolymorphaceae bacterium]